jgi:hypothetical protein
MPTDNGRVRILEIDNHPYQIASEIEKTLAAILDEQLAVGEPLGITLKAGELYDTDIRQVIVHSSFWLTSQPIAKRLPNGQSKRLLHSATKLNYP